MKDEIRHDITVRGATRRTRRRPQVSAEALAAAAKALGHPARIHILTLLLERQNRIGCEIVEHVGLAQSTISEHLRILADAGIVIGTSDRPRVCYALRPQALAGLGDFLSGVAANASRGGANATVCFPTRRGRSKPKRAGR